MIAIGNAKGSKPTLATVRVDCRPCAVTAEYDVSAGEFAIRCSSPGCYAQISSTPLHRKSDPSPKGKLAPLVDGAF